jgi:protein-L-isoaspartate O-methyltransferase
MLNELSKDELIEILHATSNALDSYNRYLRRELGFGNSGMASLGPGKRHKDHHEFIPTNGAINILMWLLDARNHIRKKRGRGWRGNLKFLDCGCGVGNIMALAKRVDGIESIAGIEYDRATCLLARKLLLRPGYRRENVIHGDLVNFGNYGEYDIIYYYEPINGHRKAAVFYELLKNDMKVGAVIIPNGHSNVFANDKDGRFKEVQSKKTRWKIFEKIKE